MQRNRGKQTNKQTKKRETLESSSSKLDTKGKFTGCLGLVHWDDPEGWCGEGGGRRVQDGEHMYTCGEDLRLS